MIIYKVTNKINGKVYIGQTIHSLEHRKSGHERDARCQKKTTVKFHNALLKYGYDNFEWEVLKECTSQEELDYYEDFYIKKYNSTDRETGYNLKSGGKLGVVFTDEVKAKIGETTKLKWQNEECAAKMKEGLRKGTETVKLKAMENFVDFECPHCHKIIKVKPWELKSKKYCSQKCANEAEADKRREFLQKATIKNIETYNSIKKERFNLILDWLKLEENQNIVLNCKMNKLTFLNGLCSFIGIKDPRSLAKVLDVSNRKDIVIKLRELIKIYADPSDDKSEYSKEETPGNEG